jgi:hypothetical protein
MLKTDNHFVSEALKSCPAQAQCQIPASSNNHYPLNISALMFISNNITIIMDATKNKMNDIMMKMSALLMIMDAIRMKLNALRIKMNAMKVIMDAMMMKMNAILMKIHFHYHNVYFHSHRIDFWRFLFCHSHYPVCHSTSPLVIPRYEESFVGRDASCISMTSADVGMSSGE